MTKKISKQKVKGLVSRKVLHDLEDRRHISELSNFSWLSLWRISVVTSEFGHNINFYSFCNNRN